jgi:oligopeptide/dipeptide ABC transporter ATP-binding protein
VRKKLLEIHNLVIDYYTVTDVIHAVRGVDLDLYEGEALCIVGESGCGKSTLGSALALMLPPNAIVRSGSIIYNGIDLLKAGRDVVEKIRGREISMVFQDPLATFSPLHTVGEVLEDIAIHKLGVPKEEAKKIAIEALKNVRIVDVERVLKSYPHELSGGMLQRIAIAAALLVKPRVLIADEPTTMLDATIQLQILDLLEEIMRMSRISLVLITHNINVARKICERVVVMYAGKVVEEGDTEKLLAEPLHPYTQLLLKAIPRAPHRIAKVMRIPGEVPDPRNDIAGCPFANRCPNIFDRCFKEVDYVAIDNRKVLCNLYRKPG